MKKLRRSPLFNWLSTTSKIICNNICGAGRRNPAVNVKTEAVSMLNRTAFVFSAVRTFMFSEFCIHSLLVTIDRC
jgi:hypothetical protein